MVFLVLYVICKSVCLNRLVIVRMIGLKYVKVVLVFVFVGRVVVFLNVLIYSIDVVCRESIIFCYDL
jgi:hypothetical protein